MLNVFIGFDVRQPIAYNVAQYSVIKNASQPVSVIPLMLNQLPIKRRGLTEFTYSRFLVPYLSNYSGMSMFMDPDMIVTGDVVELFKAADPIKAVSVVQEQARFEWPSMMVFSNSCCKKLTPEFVEDTSNALFDFEWAPSVGELPKEWNKCCFYDQSDDEANLYHFTVGLPVWEETQGLCKEEELWVGMHREANSTVGYNDLMANSVHDKHIRANGGTLWKT